MRTANTIMSLLLLSAVCVGPAYANWFSNARTNTMFNIGSAPNPTPANLRRIGDSNPTGAVALETAAPQQPVLVAEPVAYVTPEQDSRALMRAKLIRMEGKPVFGAHVARLGSILAINVAERMAEVQTPGGVAVAVPTSLLTDKGGRLSAISLSPLDMMAMAKTQTGHTVAINIDRRHLILRTTRG